MPSVAVGACALVLGAVGARLLGPGTGDWSGDAERQTSQKTLRFTIPSKGVPWGVEPLSPDGQGVVLEKDGALWLYDLASAESSRIPGTEDCDRFLAWSSDGGSIAFQRGGWLETLRLGESRGERRCALPERAVCFSWGDDGSFLVEVGGRSEGVFHLAPGASELVQLDWLDPTTLTTPHRFNPAFLPGAERFLVVDSSGGEPWVCVASLSSRTTERLLRSGNRATYVPPGYVAWVDQGHLFVQPFDAEAGTLGGAPRELAGDVSSFASTGWPNLSFSAEGTLAYLPMFQPNRIEWLDRQGRVLGPAADPQPYSDVRLDRTGRWLAASVITPRNGYRDLWVVDLERGTPQRFTDQPGWESVPCWSPDGQRIAFAADWSGPPNLFVQDLGGGPPRELVPFDNRVQYVGSWSSDGRWVLYMSRATSGAGAGLWRVDTETLERRPLLDTPADEAAPQASPDGRWLAYLSNASGSWEAYVGTYPDLEGVRRVSTGGASTPRWSADSSQLYFSTREDAIVSVRVGELDGLPDPDTEVVVLQPIDDLLTYDLTPDAERFLVVRQSEVQVRPVLHAIVGWEGLLD